MKKVFISLLILIFLIISFSYRILFAQQIYQESPMLAELVKQGKLPPVEKRLPENPLVIKPIESIGKYGGTLRFFIVGADWSTFTRTIGYEPLVRWNWDTDFTRVMPNIAESWKILSNNREFIFYLRKGMKWSDGQPFTADDIIFWYKDVLLNKDLTPVFPSYLTAGNRPVVIEKIDDYTVKFKFSSPYGSFLQQLACVARECWLPKHYLKQFHPKYTDINKLNRMAKEAGYDAWYKLFAKMSNYYENPERPTLYAWIFKSIPTAPGKRVVAERSPYYWKVDTQGNQLPYIDKITYDILTDSEVAIIKTMAGEYDVVDRMVITPETYPLFLEGQKKGNYNTRLLKPADMNIAVIQFNQTYNEDPILRKIFNDRRFRIAVSYAINREEIINLLYYGLSKPRQPAPLEQSPFYNAKYANAYLEYNPKEANRLLDEMGLKRGPDGYRLRPDGKRLEIIMEIAPDYRPDLPDLCEVLKKYLVDIGIKMEVKLDSAPLFRERILANKHQVVIWGGDGGMEVLFEPRYYIPSTPTASCWAVEWAKWVASGGKYGEEPPRDIRRMISWYNEMIRSSDLQVQKTLMNKILDMHYKNLYVIGICSIPDLISIVHNRIKNAPPWWWDSYNYPNPAPIGLYQLYIEE